MSDVGVAAPDAPGEIATSLHRGTNWWGAFVIGLAGTILVTGIVPFAVQSMGAAAIPAIALVDELHRAAQDHPQPGGWLAVLDQWRLPGLVHALLGGGGESPQLGGRERVERRVASQECVQVLHVGPRNCVR